MAALFYCYQIARIFAAAVCSVAAGLTCGGKSGQHRAPCYLTGRRCKRKFATTASVTETKPSRLSRDKGEKAG